MQPLPHTSGSKEHLLATQCPSSQANMREQRRHYIFTPFSHSLALTCPGAAPKSTTIALSSGGGLSAEMWSCCQIEIFQYASICQVYDFMFTRRGDGGVRRRRNERSSGLPHLIRFSTFHFTLSIHFPAPKMIRIIHVLQRCL